jgi:hypothetical protein
VLARALRENLKENKNIHLLPVVGKSNDDSFFTDGKGNPKGGGLSLSLVGCWLCCFALLCLGKKLKHGK